MKILVVLTKMVLIWFLTIGVPGLESSARGYSANRIRFEFRPGGIYRVSVNYTVPELKEFRESYVEFRKKRDAERFYYDLLRGADFYPPDPKAMRFISPPKGPTPW